MASPLDELEQRLAEDAARLEALAKDMSDLSPAVGPMQRLLADQLERWRSTQGAWDGSVPTAIISRLRANMRNVANDQLRLASAVHTGDDDEIEAVMADLYRKVAQYDDAGGMKVTPEAGPVAVAAWPPTIKPSKPPRQIDADDDADDDDPVGEYKPAGGFLSTTIGKVGAALGVAALVRWVMK